jgi:hypothetical protein
LILRWFCRRRKRKAAVAQYIVAQIDTLPVLDGPPSGYSIYRVNAADAIAAATAVATAQKSMDPLVTYVVLATSFIRYTSTPSTSFVSVAG